MLAPGGFDEFQIGVPFQDNGFYTVGESYDPNGEIFTTDGFAAVGSNYYFPNGTSFAAPLVAGAAAMVLQAHPTWTAAQVKSAVVNYAAAVATDDFGDPLDVQEVGNGLLNAGAAVGATVTAVPSTLSFGYLKSGTALPLPIAITLSNFGSSAVSLVPSVTAGMNGTTTRDGDDLARVERQRARGQRRQTGHRDPDGVAGRFGERFGRI